MIVGNDDLLSVDGILLQGLYKPQNVQNGNSVNQRLKLAGFYTPQKRKYQIQKEKHLPTHPPIFGVPAVGRFRGCFFFFFSGAHHQVIGIQDLASNCGDEESRG